MGFYAPGKAFSAMKKTPATIAAKKLGSPVEVHCERTMPESGQVRLSTAALAEVQDFIHDGAANSTHIWASSARLGHAGSS